MLINLATWYLLVCSLDRRPEIGGLVTPVWTEWRLVTPVWTEWWFVAGSIYQASLYVYQGTLYVYQGQAYLSSGLSV